MSADTLTIFIDDEPYDVADHYRVKHKMALPPTPTMSGAELLVASRGGVNQREVVQVDNERGSWIGDIIPAQRAVALTDGMRFATFPIGEY